MAPQDTKEQAVTYTPGPWTATRNEHGWTIAGPVDGGVWLIAETVSDISEDAQNAVLLAAAPDLLAALKSLRLNRACAENDEQCRCVKCGECGHEIGWPLNSFEAPICDDCVIGAAIAKAEGKS